MALFSELTPDQQQALQNYDTFMRNTLRALRALLQNQRIEDIGQYYTDEVAAAFAALTTGTEVTAANLKTGASNFTTQEFNSLRLFLNGVSNNLDTNLSLVIKAIGIE